jgi:hypothetical protein
MIHLYHFIQIIMEKSDPQSKGLVDALSLLCRQSLLKAAQVAH